MKSVLYIYLYQFIIEKIKLCSLSQLFHLKYETFGCKSRNCSFRKQRKLSPAYEVRSWSNRSEKIVSCHTHTQDTASPLSDRSYVAWRWPCHLMNMEVCVCLALFMPSISCKKRQQVRSDLILSAPPDLLFFFTDGCSLPSDKDKLQFVVPIKFPNAGNQKVPTFPPHDW